MFSVITNIYNNKTKGPTLMELFTATEKMKSFFFDNYRCSMYAPLVARHTRQCVWQELEYRIVVCRVTRAAHIEYL